MPTVPSHVGIPSTPPLARQPRFDLSTTTPLAHQGLDQVDPVPLYHPPPTHQGLHHVDPVPLSTTHHLLTKVWTMWTLCLLICVRNSYTLTVFSSLILSNMESRRMKVPVRPTPALQWTNMGLFSFWWWWCSRRMKVMREVAYLGTPLSGQPRNWKW